MVEATQEITTKEKLENNFMESVEKMMEILAQIITKNEEEKTGAGLDLLLKMISNILENQADFKYRNIKSSNTKIQSTIFSLEGGISDLILSLGFIQHDDAYIFSGNYFKVLKYGQGLIKFERDLLKMDPDMRIYNREKRELLEKRKIDAQIKLAEQRKVDEVEAKKHEKAQQERHALKITEDSKANPKLFMQTKQNNTSGKKIEYMTTMEEFEKLHKQAGKNKVVCIEYTASWCPPCKHIGPIFDELATEYTKLVYRKVDVDEAKEISQQEGIEAMPCFKFYQDGDEIDEIKGANEDALKHSIAKYNK